MNFFDTPTGIIAKREIAEGLRAKSTRILLAISVVAVAGLVIVANLASGDDGPENTTIAVASEPAAAELDSLRAIGSAVGTEVTVSALGDDDAARQAVADGDADLAILDDGATLLTDEPIEADDTSTVALLTNAVRSNLALDNGLADAGLDADAVAAVRDTPPPALEHVREAESDSVDGSRIGTALAINVVLFLMLQTYGGWILQGVTREKASRVIEVLMSAVTARQLLIGKVVGIGAVALLNALVLVATALITSRIVGLDVLNGFRAGDLLLGAAWFLVGYSMYCSAFAAAGALCSRAEDAQGASFPVMLPMLAGYIVSFSAAGGVSALHWALAFFPPTAVIVMPVIYAIGEAEVWHLVVSMGLAVVFTVVVALIASRIYQRSVLKSGKRVPWREALGRGSSEAAA